MTVLSTFLKPLNFLFNNLKKPTKFSTIREKSGVKLLLLLSIVWHFWR